MFSAENIFKRIFSAELQQCLNLLSIKVILSTVWSDISTPAQYSLIRASSIKSIVRVNCTKNMMSQQIHMANPGWFLSKFTLGREKEVAQQ
jgi:hypothetical protein